MDKSIFGELTELHVHVGSAVDPPIMWEIAHEQGIKLPTKNYWDFVEMVTIHETKSYEDYLKLYDWTEKIQSSPEALFLGVQNMISGAYRKNNITKIELRFNPILRNRDREKDLLSEVGDLERVDEGLQHAVTNPPGAGPETLSVPSRLSLLRTKRSAVRSGSQQSSYEHPPYLRERRH